MSKNGETNSISKTSNMLHLFDDRISLSEYAAMARNWICFSLILLALNAYSLNLGYASAVFSRSCGFLSLIAVTIFYHKYYINIRMNKILALGLLLVLSSLIILLFPLSVEFWLISLPLFICGLDLILRSANIDIKEFAALSLSCIFYTIFYILYIHFKSLWIALQSLSLASSGIIGKLVGVSLSLGPTMSGTSIFLTFLFCGIAFFILSERNKQSCKAFLFFVAGLLIVYLVYILVNTTAWMNDHVAMDYLYLVFLMYLVPFLIFVPRFKIRSIAIGDLFPTKGKWAVLCVIFMCITFTSIFPYFYNGAVGKVVFYEKDSEMGFDLPRFPQGNESFVPYSGFSVGAFCLYLEKIGYIVEHFNNADAHTLRESLKDANILMMINLNKSLDASDLDTIWEFVRNGGNLLIFGDHTSMFVNDTDFRLGRDYFNDVLKPTGIRFNPDTADFIRDHWTYGMAALPHPASRDLGFDISDTSVGASLNLSGEARPVITGRYAFSDKANSTASGHLGNRSYDKGEMFGDLVLVASDTYGKGKVLVFGDTAYIFNANLPYEYKFVDDFTGWLMSSKSISLSFVPWISTIFLLVLILCHILGKMPLPGPTIGLFASVSLIIAISIAAYGALNDSLISMPEKQNSDIAWIDHAHLNKFDIIGYTDGGADGLIINLMRNSYLPLVLTEKDNFSEVLSGKILVIIAPRKAYTPTELSILEKFVSVGGLLIISAGYDSTSSLETALKSFDINIQDLPIGSPPYIVETHFTGGSGIVTPENLKKYWHNPKFMEAYPVLAKGEYDPITWLNYQGREYNLIIARSYGLGKVILIGDSRFLLNENLESLSPEPAIETREQYQMQWLGNIELLREMLRRYAGVGT